MKRILLIFFLYCSFLLFSQDFTQITTGEIVNDGGWNYACCWADFAGDGADDLFVCNNDADNGKHNFLYMNYGYGTFDKVTYGEIVTDGNSSYGCAAADYDNDDDIDLFVANYNENNCLYQNSDFGSFTKISTGGIVTNMGKSTGCEWVDYDRDGWLDLFVCNRDEPNFLYNNNGDGTFTRITGQPLVTESKNSGNCCWADFDGNGYPDVFIANSGPDYNSLFLNNGDGTFSAVTNDPVVSDLESFDICCTGDYDNDGDFDILAAPGMLPASAYDLYLYQNNGDGTFVRIQGLSHAGINMGGGCAMIDYDNDGDLDIFVNAYDGNNIVLENDGTGNFSQITTGVLVNSGSYNKEPSWTDFDLDGDLDVFFAVNNYFGGNNKLFSNDGNANNWLYLDLVGFTSNRNGIDALIHLTAQINGQEITQTKRVSDRNSLTTHFGLGNTSIIEEIVVEWPSGEISTLSNVAVNQIITIQESITPFNPPQNLLAEVQNFNEVLLSWQPPEGDYDFIQHHNGYDNNGIGAGLNMQCAARFTADELSDYYDDYEISKIAVYFRDYYSSVVLKIWEGGSFGYPGTEVYSQEIIGELIENSWNVHVLPNPVPLISNNEYWIGYHVEAIGGHPASVDGGPNVADKGAWIYYGYSWVALTSVAPLLDFNWCITGIVSPIDAENDNDEIYLGDNVSRNSRELTGYRIYRNEEQIAEISDPAVMEYFDDQGLDAGNYEYYVTAVYSDPAGESEPSNIAAVEIILPAPENVTATLMWPDILIEWDNPSDGRAIESYNVYRDLALIANTSSNSYLDINVPTGCYTYNIACVFTGGYEGEWSEEAIPVGNDPNLIQMVSSLNGNSPNPFNPETKISFTTTNSHELTHIEIFNLKGQKIKTLVNDVLTVGNHSVVWNGTDETGKDVTSGFYLYKMKSGDYQKTRKMILLK